MERIKVNLGERSYAVIIANDSYANLGREIKNLSIGKDAFIITDRIVEKLLGKKISLSLKNENLNPHIEIVPPSEKSKSINIWSKLVRRLADFDKKKELFLVALGGGVVGDLTGFLASVYKRGIPYVQIPTTLLAQVDSAIGGKNAIDLPCGKNILGTFYQPRLVYSEISVLKNLPLREIRNGLAEVIKYGAIKNKFLFEYLENTEPNYNHLDWKFIISECSKIKAKIVEHDEYDKKGLRMLLNFGHTVGHGIETASEYSRKYSHGEAISLGMLCSAEIGIRLGITPLNVLERLEKLIAKIGLPQKINYLNPESIISAITYDKKFRGKKTRMVILKEIGRAIVVEDIPWSLIKKAIEKRIE
ncbi:MAG: 3-dehydroquinate synthase [Candidatus Omnitrophota bacterium]